MNKLILVFLLFVTCVAYCQSEYVIIKDLYGNKKKVKAATSKDILIVSGDSLYNLLNNYAITDSVNFELITHPDSIQKFLSERIKGIIILDSRKEKQKPKPNQ